MSIDVPFRRDPQSGFALLAVMIGLIVISILALGLILVTKSGIEEAHSDLAASEGRAFFDAVIMESSVSLLDTSESSRPRIDGVTQRINVFGQMVPVSITCEFGKVDLNAADTATLSNLLEAAGEGPAEAADESAQIVNFRTGGTGTASIHLFRTIREIMQVPSITANLYNRINTAVTVYSGRGHIDETTAPLLALEAIPGMDRPSAEAIVHDRLTSQNDNQDSEVTNGQLAPGISITGWAFQIEASFKVGNRRQDAEAVVRMTGDPTRPYFILWRQEIPE